MLGIPLNKHKVRVKLQWCINIGILQKDTSIGEPFYDKKISTSHLFNENNPREDRDKKIETFYNNEIMRRGPQS